MIMEYIVTTNKDELDLIESGYFEICPGTFKKTFWNEDSIFISDALMYYILEDIIAKSNDEFSTFFDFTYFNAEHINKFGYELSIRINEISKNKIIFDANREYLNKEIEKYRKEIIEVLPKLLSWIELNKINGFTIIKKWQNYKILKIDDLPEVGGGYLEFLPGKFENKCWNDNSVYIHEVELDIVDDLLWKVNNEYYRYGVEYFYDENQIRKLENELIKRLNEIISNESVSKGVNSQKYYDNINRNMELYKNEMIEMLDNFIQWIKLNKSNGITVIGM